MEFCPTCGNMLQFDAQNLGQKARLFCPTCPYICEIENKIKRRQPLVKKTIEPIFNSKDEMKTAKKTSVNCPDCNSIEAYFIEFQTRSADEPMSRFYRCCNDECNREWREE